MVGTIVLTVVVAALLIALLIATIKYRWIQRTRRWLTGDTRVIVEAPAVKKAVRCGKCHCKFTFTAQDVYAGYSGSTLNCPGCNQCIRLWDPEKGDLYGVGP